jgi:hypothetical protein
VWFILARPGKTKTKTAEIGALLTFQPQERAHSMNI